MCIRFDHPTKKNELVLGSPWEADMAGVGASMGAHGELAGGGTKKEGGGERGLLGGGAWGRGYTHCSLLAASYTREEETWEEELNVRKKRRRKEKRKRNGRKRKERKRKNMEKFLNMKIY
jgi:hypothetical protein